MKINLDEFRKYLQIDKNSLDDELIRQPSLLFEISEEYAKACGERDALKEELSTTDATTAGAVRLALEKAGAKSTESMIKDAVQVNKRHHDTFGTYIKAKEQAETLLALKEAFQSRGYMLRDLCSLYVSNYYEASSAKGTDRTDTAVYYKQRERLAQGRKQKD